MFQYLPYVTLLVWEWLSHTSVMATNVSGFPVSYMFLANKQVDVTKTDCVQGEVWAEAAETVEEGAYYTSQHTRWQHSDTRN